MTEQQQQQEYRPNPGDPRMGNVSTPSTILPQPGRPADSIVMKDRSADAITIGRNLILRPVESFYVGQYEVVTEAGKKLRNNAGLEAIWQELLTVRAIKEMKANEKRGWSDEPKKF